MLKNLLNLMFVYYIRYNIYIFAIVSHKCKQK